MMMMTESSNVHRLDLFLMPTSSKPACDTIAKSQLRLASTMLNL